MINKDFKKLKTNIKSFSKNTNWNDNLISIIINGKDYQASRKASGLTKKQLEYFKYIPDFENAKGISL